MRMPDSIAALQNKREVDDRLDQIIDFYTNHPISHANILSTLHSSRSHLQGLRPEELFPHDQDHYNGLEANAELAKRAHLVEGTRVADFGAGLGGPARYFAHRYGADVTGIEVTPNRVLGANDLTQRVGLHNRVRVLHGNVICVPLADRTMDVVLSQEALLHVRDKKRVFQEAHRILRKGGRLAFTDWVTYGSLSPRDTNLVWAVTPVRSFQDVGSYQDIVRTAGFKVISIDDTSHEWVAVLTERLARHLHQKQPQGQANSAFEITLTRLITLVQEQILGGARITAEK
jgi:SAM-dependent methyltransferase